MAQNQGNLLNTITFTEFTDLVRRNFVAVQQMVEPKAMPLFIQQSVPQGQGKTKQFDEVDTETFARNKPEGQDAKKARIGIGYSVTMKKKRIAMEIDITQEMRDENRYAEVGSLITNLSHFPIQRRELDLNHIFTFSDSTSYTDMDGDTVDVSVGDGKSLLNSSHDLKHSSSTYSNLVTGSPTFSKSALESAEELAVSNVLSNFGERRVMNFNTIVTSDDPTTVNTVKRFLKSTTDDTQQNPDVINVYENKYRHIALPYLATDETGARNSAKKEWWFLVAAQQGVNGWQAYYGEWEAPHMKDMTTQDTNANHNYSADVWTFGTRAGYGIKAVSGRGIIGSQP